MALRLTKTYISIYLIIIILFILLISIFQSTFFDFYNENEELESNAIVGDIEVFRNKFGFAKVKTNSIEDYYFAVGFIQSYDRFLQLELLRKLAKGELSSFLQENHFELDKIIRDIDLKKRAEYNYKLNLNSPFIEYLNNYVSGINFFISNYNNKLPLEFGLINYNIKKFTVKDIFLIEEIYNLMYDNNLKLNLFGLISSIKLGINKSKNLFNHLGITLDEGMLKTISSRKYTYGELNYLMDIYKYINLINYGIPLNFDSPYFIKSNNSILFSYNHYSKTFMNFSPYYTVFLVGNDTLSGLYKIGSPFPNVMRKNELIFSELNQNLKSNYLTLFDISNNKLNYSLVGDSTLNEFEIGIDTIALNDNTSKLKYFYNTKNNNKVINHSQEDLSIGLAIGTYNLDLNNKFEYLHNLLFFNKIDTYHGSNLSYIYLKDSLKFKMNLGKYLNKIDTLNIFSQDILEINDKKEIQNLFFHEYKLYSPYNERLKELLSDDHKFNLTDIRLINNDNKNRLAEVYLGAVLKSINFDKNNDKEVEIYKSLKNWDFIEEQNRLESFFFEQFLLNIIEEFMVKYYDIELKDFILDTPYLKLVMIKNIFELTKDEVTDSIISTSWQNTLELIDYKNGEFLFNKDINKINHILTYFNKKDLINLPLENYKGSENSINFFHNFVNYLITNNSSIIFKLNENKNYVIQNSGQSGRIESEWNKNLFKIWTTGGLVESNLNYDKMNKIIHIKKK